MDRFLEIIAWTLIVFIAVVVVICIGAMVYSVPILDEGIVIDKIFDPANTTYMYHKVGNVSYMQPLRDDEDWILRVQGTTDEGKDRVENWEVSREYWEQTQIGDRVTRVKK